MFTLLCFMIGAICGLVGGIAQIVLESKVSENTSYILGAVIAVALFAVLFVLATVLAMSAGWTVMFI